MLLKGHGKDIKAKKNSSTCAAEKSKTNVSMATKLNLSKIVMIKWNKYRRGKKMRLDGRIIP